MKASPLTLSRPVDPVAQDILPHAIEAEHAVLAAVLLDGIRDREVVGTVLDQLAPEAFFDTDHRLIYAAARKVREAGQWPDPVQVSDVLRADGDLDRVGGLEYLLRLLDGVPSAANIRAHAAILEEKSTRRAAIAAGRRLARDAADPSVSLDDLRVRAAEEAEGLAVRTGLGGDPREAFPTLRDLRERPELLAPPEEVIPCLGWRARTTGIVAPPKAGKSTLAGQAVAAATTAGHFLGKQLAGGSAVVAAPDEAVGDTVRRLHEVGAHPDRVRVLTLRPPDLLGSMDALLRAEPADLVVVDSLAEWARLTLGTAPDDGDSSGWGAVVRPLVQLSRDHDCAVLLLHHPRRSDGQYRGSGEIAAALDCLLEMTLPRSGEDPTLRRIRGQARWPVEDFTLRLEGERYVLGGGGEIPLEARILIDTRANPGTSRTAQHGRLGGRKATIVAAVNLLLERGALVDRGDGLFVSEDQPGNLL